MNIFQRLRVIHRAWRLRLRHDRHELSFLFRHVGRGQRVLDIGANKGAYSYWLSKITGRAGEVIAFEPQPALARFIETMSRDFGLRNIKVVNSALSSRSGTAMLHQPDIHPLGGATLHAPATSSTQFEVRVETLDACLLDVTGPPVSFIKCDVEGHEYEVLQGGEALLHRFRPVLLFEWSCLRSTAIFDYLKSLGYRGAHAFACGQAYRFEDFHQDPSRSLLANFSFFHKDHRFWSASLSKRLANG